MKTDITAISVLTDDDGNITIDVKTTIVSEDRLTVVLLEVVENLTGVSTSNYIDEVDAARERQK